MRCQIILSHGSDSGPGASKISALAARAEALGWSTSRPDYREDDAPGHAASVAPRLARLTAAVAAASEPPLLVGSSMGAFVSGLASLTQPVAGLLLLATPAQIPGYPRPFALREGVPCELIHGWRDEVCSYQALLPYASQRRLPLSLLDDDHRLSASLPRILASFECMLASLVA